jgi:glycosyltransferase involved in cell wall biosynthesis
MLIKKINKEENNEKYKYFFFIFLIIIIFNIPFYNISIFLNIKFLISYLESTKEIKRNKLFYRFCFNKIKIIKYKKINNPKISIISPIFNRQRYILRFINFIHNQNFRNLEIIFIDDFSIDNSVQMIEKYQKKDKRIKLIKNKANRGTFLSRNIGVLYSNAEYLVIPDPDDILSKNILNECYKFSEKYNIELIRFNMLTAKGKVTLYDIIKKLKKRPIYYPNIYHYLFYGSNELEKIDYHICNKFIKKNVYIRAINSFKKFYLDMYIIYRDDSIINFMLYSIAKSFAFIKSIGYYYSVNSLSVTNNLFSKSNLRIKFAFVFLKLIFEYSKNTKYEKDMFNFIFTLFNLKFNLVQKKSALTNNSKYYYNLIKIFLSSKYLTKSNKLILNNFKKLTMK